MLHKIKIQSEEKVRFVTFYLVGIYGYGEAADIAGTNKSTFIT